MTGKKLQPVFTQNFSNNLDQIEQYFAALEASTAFAKMMKRLVKEIVPLVRNFPQSGRSFLDRKVGSVEGTSRTEKLATLMHAGDDLREFIFDDYLLLYLVRDQRVVFLSIKHHRQLSFDLRKFWVE